MEYITPIMISIIVLTAVIRKKPVYHDFIQGAGCGLKLLADIFPPLVAMLTAVSMMKASGILDILMNILSPVTTKIGIPPDVMPLIIIRPFSGSGAVGVLSGVLNNSGPDSITGRMASVICGSTETTFYCLSVYLSKTRVTNISRAIPCAIAGDITGIIFSAILLHFLG